MEYYPCSLFKFDDPFVSYYCFFLRGFMRLLSDRLARVSGLMGSVGDDALRFGTVRQLEFIMRERSRFHDIARYSLSNSPFDWAPDLFDGLGAHSSLLWYRREAPVLDVFGVRDFSPSLAECRALGHVLDKICGRFRGSVLSAFLEELSGSFYGFCEYHDSLDIYRLGLPYAVESIVLRSGMLSFSDCPGLVCWLGDRLPVVETSSRAFPTDPSFVGAYVPMRNFGEGGYVAHVEYDGAGVVVPMKIVVRGEYCLHNSGRIVYNSSYPYDEVISLTNVYSDDPILFTVKDMALFSRH
jgi:hypothetical protein